MSKGLSQGFEWRFNLHRRDAIYGVRGRHICRPNGV